MRYQSDQKEKSKKAILQAAAKALRQGGYHGVGVDKLAASAGVTSGAFYSNFSNKEELLKEVIGSFLGQPFIGAETKTLEERRQSLREFVSMYISSSHRKEPENGCVMPTLSADVARASPAVRRVYQQRMQALVEKVASVMSGSAAAKRKQAWTLIGLMVGAISVATALPDGDDAQEMIDAAFKSAGGMLEGRFPVS